MNQTTNQEVILVNDRDEAIGFADKISAHRDGGQVHRAFSVLIFNSRGEMLLQLRAASKYHFAGLWTNACCGHPARGDTVEAAARRRLREEFGFETELQEICSFFYEAHDPVSGLSEREWDHVLEGTFDGVPVPNAAEIDDYKWITMDQLELDVNSHPENYTPWFPIVCKQRR